MSMLQLSPLPSPLLASSSPNSEPLLPYCGMGQRVYVPSFTNNDVNNVENSKPLQPRRPSLLKRHRSDSFSSTGFSSVSQQQLCFNKPKIVKRTTRVKFSNAVRIRQVTPQPENWIDEKTFLRTAAILKRRANLLKAKQPELSPALDCLRNSYQPNSDKGATRKSVQLVARTELRGLEQRLLPAIRAHRKKVVSHILLMQKKLQMDGLVNAETRDYLLHQKSRQLSQASRQLALKLAQADVLALRVRPDEPQRAVKPPSNSDATATTTTAVVVAAAAGQ